ncbi:hypothetical protein Tco_0424536 [Tanacetum coccineum]
MGDENTIRTFEDYSKPSYEGYRNTIELHLLGVMECKVDTLMKEAISLMEKSESEFGMTSNTVYQLPSEPSRQEEFENLVMNFILDQEEKVKQLEEYMGLVPQSFDTEVLCTKGDDGEVMFIELIRKNDDSSKGEPKEEGSTTTE